MSTTELPLSPASAVDHWTDLGLLYLRYCERAAVNAPLVQGTKAERAALLDRAAVQVDAVARFLAGALRIDWDLDPHLHPLNLAAVEIQARLHARIADLQGQSTGGQQ
ncbi:MAG: hypothetical protein ABS43_01675 [Bordetella sp. SCN 67-23]|nr:hypothetical protein [Burkholderiales bacterium]ODS76281.1 MAG: hypothetical protein ABS43_01675 [Bordetella sp. SCN 67-23]OJW90084.1 MAG: hypothetical protein BGO71_27610 [Burkholderiales bacterium 67-32]